uniref:TopBP1-interacting, checkpoint, and replication regulator n=1 Tax=Mastacembelus armatus TaxID=205130 RepID=A0A3Q3NCT1_9TELE
MVFGEAIVVDVMALHNLVFVIDVDFGDRDSGDQIDVRNHLVKRGLLQILLHFGYKYGFEKVRWGYKFFQSKTGRNGSFMSRVSDFKELRHKTFEDFEAEFDAKFDVKEKVCLSHQKHQSNRSASVQNALKEALLDFQWDRPHITSPTKLSLRPRKSSRVGKPSVSQEDDVSVNGRNLVFIVSDCPRSSTQLVDYLSLGNHAMHTDVTEHIISKSLQDMLVQRQVVLHWIDSGADAQVLSLGLSLGSGKLAEVLAEVGGRVIPVIALLNLCYSQKPDVGFRRDTFAFMSIIGYLLSTESLYRQTFPATQGFLRWGQGNVTHNCGIIVEPVSCRQRLLPQSVEVCLKGVLQGWDPSSLTHISMETWVLQCSSSDDQEAVFQHLLMELSAHALHMLAEVNDNSLLVSAVLSPLSYSTALLTILQPGITQNDQLLTMENIAPATAEPSHDLPDVVSSVLGVVYNIMEEDDDSVDDKQNNHPVPEWAQRELSHCPMTAAVLETWFPQSDQSGVSSHLMESIKLLHAVQETREEEDLSDLQQELISGLGELYQTSQGTNNKRGKKRGAQRTPVKQKMKTMSRSLQMLNVARLNVKAQKNQAEAEQLGAEGRVTDRLGKRRSSERNKSGTANTISFMSEAQLLTHLKSSYEKTVAEKDSSLVSGVQQLLTAVKTFLVAESDLELKTSLFVQQHLLKTSKSIRQLYGTISDVDSKIRECQLQAVLRLELCRLVSSGQSDSLDVDQMAEEVAEMLRVISLTKDPVCLSRFLQDEVLPGFLTTVPRVLADIYHSLGTQLPEALVALLPSDFFSDESVAKDSVSPSASSPPLSTQSLGLGVGDCLQELRNRSANKRRSGLLTRHRSMTESQSLRQVEMPKRTTRASKSKACVALDKAVTEPQTQKQETQEVTKVRRNLFNHEIISPSKKAKLPRSQSVSAVEGLKRKRSNDSEERHKLLTQTVCETPLHKQVSSRLIYRQKVGRRSVPNDNCIVEESPVKPTDDVRRSPRIKKFARRHSNTFYSSSQPRSRNLDRALSTSQLAVSDGKIRRLNIKEVRSPMRLLFGAAISPRSRLSTDSSVFESPSKTPTKSPSKHGRAILGNTTPRTPRTPHTQGTTKTPPSSKKCVLSVAENPVTGNSYELGMALRGSPFRFPARKILVVDTPTKQSPVRSPLKGILRTPVKALTEGSSSSGLHLLNSPKTPRKSVTWSPSPHKCRVVENSANFKVPESPCIASHSSVRLVKTPTKCSSPVENINTKKDIFKTQEKTCQVSLVRVSENANGIILTQEKLPNRMTSPEKGDCVSERGISSRLSTLPLDHHLSPKPNTTAQNKTPSPTHQMITRSGRTPGKCLNIESPYKPDFEGLTIVSDRSATSVKSPAKSLIRTRSGQHARTPRCNLRSQSGENVRSKLNTVSAESCDLVEKSMQSDGKEEVQAEPSLSSETDSSSHTDPQQFDSSHLNSASTDDDSLDIVNAAVVNTQFSGGLKMNISFSRKPSNSNDDTSSPKQYVLPQGTPGRNYGFRQTPDRQQREAAARLGYGNDCLRFSTPRGAARPSRKKGTGTPNSRTYQVEMEMQTSGLPKLRIKRSDSMNAGDFASDTVSPSGAQCPLLGVKPHLESPLALFSKHRDPGCVSPSVCTHVTPAKSTPGKGCSVQTYICQSYTPTHHSGGTLSPVATAEIIPLTPSPQSVGKVTPENLNSWPRRKRAQVVLCGGKDRGLKGEPLLEELLEEAELGVSRLQDIEDIDEPPNNKAATLALTSTHAPPVRTGTSLSPMEDLFWMEKCAQQAECADPQRAEEEIWASANGDVKSYEAVSGRMVEVDGLDVSPFSQSIRRSNTGRTYSRKRLLH